MWLAGWPLLTLGRAANRLAAKDQGLSQTKGLSQTRRRLLPPPDAASSSASSASLRRLASSASLPSSPSLLSLIVTTNTNTASVVALGFLPCPGPSRSLERGETELACLVASLARLLARRLLGVKALGSNH